MIRNLHSSIKAVNLKLYRTLLLISLIPAVYTSLRIYFIGQLPNEWAYSIAGQLTWISLIYEILNESIILPLFYLISKPYENKTNRSDKICTGLIFTTSLYLIMALFICCSAESLLYAMAADKTIIEVSSNYIRIESIANIFAMLVQYLLVVFIVYEQRSTMYILLILRLCLSFVFDTFLISSASFSLNLGVYGIGYSNILINLCLLLISMYFISKHCIVSFNSIHLDFKWLKELFKIGGISGLESLIRNLAYIVMISRMVNLVGEQGTYWVANSFIWTWLLLPVIQLGELIKKEVSADYRCIFRNTPAYLFMTGLICLIWVLSIPFWKSFMSNFLGISNVEKVFYLVLILMISYVFYAFQNIFDSIFYALGKTEYMLFESIVTNTFYYGAAFFLYYAGFWVPTLTGITVLFSLGNIFDSLISIFAYRYFLHKQKTHRI